MRRLLPVGLLALLAPAGAQSEAESTKLPWLSNFNTTAAVDAGESLVDMAMEAEADPSCDEALSSGLTLTADVAPAAGRETIFASYARGVLVYGREGALIASMPGFPCAGSADEIEVLAAGTAFGVPMIVIAATTGGRREQLTWLGLYRVGIDGRLDAVFTGAVELREDGVVRRGSVTVLPEALLVRDPLGGVGFWVFDPVGGVYVPRGGTSGLDDAHS